MTGPLRQTAFRGDVDVEELHAFFAPDQHFDGDVLWSFGTSLKSAYVNTFEFMNHAPVVQLWRDDSGTTQAVSRLSLGTGEWFHQARPNYRTDELTTALTDHADSAFSLLSDWESWTTVRYESKTAEIRLLESMGYERQDRAEVFMSMALDGLSEEASCPTDIRIANLDAADPAMMHERAMAQIDAFSGGEPTAEGMAWITRSLPHQVSYGSPDNHPGVVALDETGVILAFADPFFDRQNRIGEFEPVGTRTAAQRTGLSKAVMTGALNEMRANGMDRAIVRTGVDNYAAIAAYESVGFEITDHLIRLRKTRDPAI